MDPPIRVETLSQVGTKRTMSPGPGPLVACSSSSSSSSVAPSEQRQSYTLLRGTVLHGMLIVLDRVRPASSSLGPRKKHLYDVTKCLVVDRQMQQDRSEGPAGRTSGERKDRSIDESSCGLLLISIDRGRCMVASIGGLCKHVLDQCPAYT